MQPLDQLDYVAHLHGLSGRDFLIRRQVQLERATGEHLLRSRLRRGIVIKLLGDLVQSQVVRWATERASCSIWFDLLRAAAAVLFRAEVLGCARSFQCTLSWLLLARRRKLLVDRPYLLHLAFYAALLLLFQVASA